MIKQILVFYKINIAKYANLFKLDFLIDCLFGKQVSNTLPSKEVEVYAIYIEILKCFQQTNPSNLLFWLMVFNRILNISLI